MATIWATVLIFGVTVYHLVSRTQRSMCGITREAILIRTDRIIRMTTYNKALNL